MRNETKYPQTYLDRLLPDASCPCCMAKCVRREVIRETNKGEYLLVSHTCEDCDTVFSVKYNMQQLRTSQQKKKTLTREETIKTKSKMWGNTVNTVPKKKLITIAEYPKKTKEETPLDSKEQKKMLYRSVSRGFNVLSIIIFFTFVFMECYEMYDLTENNNSGSIYNMMTVFVVMVGLIVFTQLVSLIYKFVGK